MPNLLLARRSRALLAVLLFGAAALAGPPANADQTPPVLTLTTLAGEDFDLAHQRGHVVLVHFFGDLVPAVHRGNAGAANLL